MSLETSIVVIGGTGITGQRLLLQAVQEAQKLQSASSPSSTRITATSRSVSVAPDKQHFLPAGALASTLTKDLLALSGERIHWMPLDFEAKPDVFVEQLSALLPAAQGKKILFLAGAFTNVEGCEVDPALCRLINFERSRLILDAGLKAGYHAVFFSTDYVFDGEQGPYAEDATTAPLNEYGRSKLHLEQWLQNQALDKFTIVRTTGIYDFVPGSKNFLMQMLGLKDAVKPFLVPRDQYGTPIWAGDLANAAWELAKKSATGIFHAGGARFLSRDEFALEILKTAQIPTKFMIPVFTHELQQKAKRPLKAGLLNRRTFDTLGWEPRMPSEVLPRLLRLTPS